MSQIESRSILKLDIYVKVVFKMNNSRFNVVFYSDGSQQAFSAAVYAATLMKNMPNMRLTVVQVHEKSGGLLRTEYNWVLTWPNDKDSNRMKQVLNQTSDSALKDKYHEILTKTDKIFSEKGMKVTNEVIYSSVVNQEITSRIY